MSRSRQLFISLLFTYGYQFLVMGVGIWLTPFLIKNIGETSFADWAVISQILLYLGIADLGVTSILSRDIAIAKGTEDPETKIQSLIKNAIWLNILQMIIIIPLAILLSLTLIDKKPEIKSIIIFLVLGNVIIFPFRLYQSILNGMQDLVFLSKLQILVWIINTICNVILVISGYGLFALVVGNLLGQIIQAILLINQFNRYKNKLKPKTLKFPGWKPLWKQLTPGLWVSLSSIVQGLYTSEIILVAALLNEQAVVIYICSTKLISIVNNYPYTLNVSSTPIIAEIRGSGNREEMIRICRSLALATMMMSGFFFVMVFTLNHAFVKLWVGESRYAGDSFTFLTVLAMTIRHFSFTFSHTLFVLNYNILPTLIGLLDSVLYVIGMGIFVQNFGLISIPYCSIGSVILVTIPITVYLLAKELKQNGYQILLWIFSWLWKFILIVLILNFLKNNEFHLNIYEEILLSGLFSLVYILLQISIFKQYPLDNYYYRIKNKCLKVMKMFKKLLIDIKFNN